MPLAFGHDAMNPGSFGGRAPKNAQHLFVHSFTKLNLTHVYATYAEPKHMEMKTTSLLFLLWIFSPMIVGFHSPPGDSMHWGGSSFRFRQMPLENKLQEFEKTLGAKVFKGNFSNPRGYVASWRIVGKALSLEAIEGELVNDKVTILDVLDEGSLPCKAVWYTGLLHLPIGEFDYETQQWPMALKIRIFEGIVRETELLHDVQDVGPFLEK